MEEDDEEFRGLSRTRIDVIVGVKQASPQKGEPRGQIQHGRSLLSRAAIGRLKTQTNAVWKTGCQNMGNGRIWPLMRDLIDLLEKRFGCGRWFQDAPWWR